MVLITLDNEEKHQEKQEEKRIQNLDEKIYFICFLNTYYTKEIANALYGKGSMKAEKSYSKIVTKTKEMTDKGWLELLDKFTPKRKNDEKIDQRSWRRLYYKANLDCIVSKIKERTSLDDFEEFVLKDTIGSPFFRNFVRSSLPSDPKSFPSDPFEYILSLLDMAFIEIDENIGLRELNVQLSTEIQTKKQYNRLKRNIRRVMRDKLPELSGVYFDKDVNRDKKEQINFVGGKSVKQQNLKQKISVKLPFRSEDPSEWIEQVLIFLIIPNTLFHKIMKASNFGTAYYELKRRFTSCSALGNFYLGKLSPK